MHDSIGFRRTGVSARVHGGVARVGGCSCGRLLESFSWPVRGEGMFASVQPQAVLLLVASTPQHAAAAAPLPRVEPAVPQAHHHSAGFVVMYCTVLPSKNVCFIVRTAPTAEQEPRSGPSQ